MHKLTQKMHSTGWQAVALVFGCFALALAAATLVPTTARAQATATKPTVVLVHGAFAESSSWDGVVARLLSNGYPVVSVANPLRGVRFDATYVGSVLDSIPGPVVLVGHSYGGAVITNAATGKKNVKSLVYVSGLAPEAGESTTDLAGKYPGSTLGPTLAPPVVLADGSKDLYIEQSKFHDQFAADVPASQTRLMAVAQRPITEAAFNEASGPPAWKTIPSWFIYGSRDKNIPPILQPFMAQRAGAKRIVEVKGSSHVVMISHPDLVASLIQEAARAADQ
jgi:pimeloyl-ACP methyl ester carboxylesterase